MGLDSFEKIVSVKTQFQNVDWSATPLGPMPKWPESLKTAVAIMLDSQFPMFVAWGRERTFLYNDAYAVILGEKHPSALGRKFEDIWAEIWEDLLPLIHSVDAGQPVYLEDMRLVMNRFGYEEVTYFTFSYSPIRDQSNQVLGLFCAVVETTKRKQSEEALAAERQKTEEQLQNDKLRLLRILENIPGAVTLVTGPEFVFTYANTSYRKLFLGDQDQIGKKVSEVLPWAVEQGFIDLLQNVYRTGVPFKGTEVAYETLLPDGTSKTMYLNMVYEPVRDSAGSVESILAAAFDATELVQAKRDAQNANLSKTAFLANMSHEIRTPMTAVLGFAEVLRELDLTPSQRDDALRRIESSGRSLLKLIDDILDISKVESGKLSIENVRFSPLEIVSEVVSLLKLQADQKGIPIKTFISSQVPAVAFSDPARIRQILTNLIGNAVKFTTKGEVRLELDFEPGSSKNQNFLVIKVSDTGIGISDQEHAKLFQPFAQADETISRQFGGTGLGLALSKRLAEQLGGSLELTSSHLGQGSQFTVKIEVGAIEASDLGLSDKTLASLNQQEAPSGAPSLNSKRILLVDDVQDNQILMRQYLESAGARVDTAVDGAEAVKRALSRDYDVIVMDIQMPVVDGIQATRQLRSQGYKQPILALTAHAMKSEIQRSLEAGCSAHLTKPISIQGLVTAVSKFL